MTTSPVKLQSFRLRRYACRPDAFTLLLTALALLGAALILARGVVYGPGMHWDSIGYISIAWNLLEGNGFANLNRAGNYAIQPPLYPLLLAAVSFGVFDSEDVAGPLNAAIFGLTIFFAGQYLRRRLQHPFLVFGACIALMLSIPLTRIAAYTLSEPLFILFTILALMQIYRFLDCGQWSDLIAAVVFTALALLTRYVGVVLLVALLPALLLLRPAFPWRQRLGAGAIYGLIALPPLALWMLSNRLLVGHWTGARMPPQYDFPTALYHTLLRFVPLLLAAVFALDRFWGWAKERRPGEKPGSFPPTDGRFQQKLMADFSKR